MNKLLGMIVVTFVLQVPYLAAMTPVEGGPQTPPRGLKYRDPDLNIMIEVPWENLYFFLSLLLVQSGDEREDDRCSGGNGRSEEC